LAGIRRHIYRNERAIQDVAKMLREADQFDPIARAIVTLARTTAASLDRLEHDPERSEYVVASTARTHLAILEACRPGMIVAGDSFDGLIDEIAAAVRDSATP